MMRRCNIVTVSVLERAVCPTWLGPSGNKTERSPREWGPQGRHAMGRYDTDNSEGEDIANKGKHGGQRKPWTRRPTYSRVREDPAFASMG